MTSRPHGCNARSRASSRGPPFVAPISASWSDLPSLQLTVGAAYGPRARVTASGPWVEVRPEPGVLGAARLPDAGWKLHLSAYPGGLGLLVTRVLPYLGANAVSIKVIASEAHLEQLCFGWYGLAQVGKAVTVYPATEAEFRRLVEDLGELTGDLGGPVISSDRYCGRGVVWRRYGAFRPQSVRGPLGAVVPGVRHPDGRLLPDLREQTLGGPEGVDDPLDAGGERKAAPVTTVLADRFLRGVLLHSSYRGTVWLGVDLESGDLCVIKIATDAMLPSQAGRAEFLRHEFAVLSELAGTAGFARALALLPIGRDLVLVQSEVPGRTIRGTAETLLTARMDRRVAMAVDVGIGICERLAALASFGRVHGDLSPDNVIQDSGKVSLVDLEVAVTPGTGRPVVGTVGYASPQRRLGARPTPPDDVYALGSLLRSIATGVDPTTFPDVSSLDRLGIRRLRTGLPTAFSHLVDDCLAEVPAARPSLCEIEERLCGVRPTPERRTGEPGPHVDLDDPACRLVERLADRMATEVGARDRADRSPTAWNWDPDLGNGAAGVALVLAMVHRAGRRVDGDAVRDLLRVPQPPGVAPGLYVGVAGAAVAALYAGTTLDDRSIVERGHELLANARGQGAPEVDLLCGAAGVVRAHVLAWQWTGRAAYLHEAMIRADALAAAQRSSRTAFGSWPDARAGTSAPWLGYAHGAAGIGDALLDVYRVTGDARLRGAVEATVRLLHERPRPSGTGLGWAATLEAEEPVAAPRWCHGSVGVGRFLAEARRVGFDVDPGLPDLALRAALDDGVLSGPSLCHGAAGVADLLADLEGTDGVLRAAEARRLRVLIDTYTTRPSEISGPPDREADRPVLLTGYGGALFWALRTSSDTVTDPLRPSQQPAR